MQTPSHALIAAALALPLRRRAIKVHMPAVVLGAILPDIPLFFLSLGGVAYFSWFAPLPPATRLGDHLFDTLFFYDPLWIVAHNFFHSLPINGLLCAVGWWAMKRGKRWGRALFWLAISMLLHTVIDIATHYDDGPLFLMPFNWRYRFASPVSYWDAAHYGRQFGIFEGTLDLLLIVFFMVSYWPALWLRGQRFAYAMRRRLSPGAATKDDPRESAD